MVKGLNNWCKKQKVQEQLPQNKISQLLPVQNTISMHVRSWQTEIDYGEKKKKNMEWGTVP